MGMFEVYQVKICGDEFYGLETPDDGAVMSHRLVSEVPEICEWDMYSADLTLECSLEQLPVLLGRIERIVSSPIANGEHVEEVYEDYEYRTVYHPGERAYEEES